VNDDLEHFAACRCVRKTPALQKRTTLRCFLLGHEIGRLITLAMKSKTPRLLPGRFAKWVKISFEVS